MEVGETMTTIAMMMKIHGMKIYQSWKRQPVTKMHVQWAIK